MPKKIILSFLLLFIGNILLSQNHTISGYIYDNNSKEILIGANIFDIKTKSGVVSNKYGYYSLTLTADINTITISYIGYKLQEIEIYLDKDTILNIELEKLSTSITQVQVYANSIQNTEVSTIDLQISQLRKLNSLGGETDIIRSLQLLPGIQSGNEGTTGLYVRGGGADQNLILLDGVPMYNVSHLFGFMSAFNDDAIKNVKLIKGGFPAQYGGRLSSVIDIRMKEGNMQKYSASTSVSLLSSKLMLEGPIIKNKAAFLISARRNYLDLLMMPYNTYQNDLDNAKQQNGYYFYDFNVKINYKFSQKNRLYLSWYSGKDKYYNKNSFDSKTISEKSHEEINWGNQLGSLRWNHVFDRKIFSNLTLNYTNYQLNNIYDYFLEEKSISNTQTYINKVNYTSNIQDFALRYDIDLNLTNNYIVKTGVNGTHHNFLPGVSNYKTSENNISVDTSTSGKNIRAYEYRVYIENKINIGKKIKTNIGLHSSLFNVNNTYYYSLEPRFSLSYNFAKQWAFKTSYTEMQQYLHLLASTGIGLPTDLWVPPTDNIPPQKSKQFTGGFYHNFRSKYNISIEGFYKTMTNMIAYKEGASYLINDEKWDEKIEKNGIGNSYGAEFFTHKQTGKLQGWIGYTLSWSFRQFENINYGKQYSYKYDRRHDISICLIYHLNKKIIISANWVYGTGNAVTLPRTIYNSTYYPIEDNFIQTFSNDILPVWYASTHSRQLGSIIEYGEKHSQRMPAYHRLDLGISNEKKTKHGVRTWSFNIYNAYNRKNPFYIKYTFSSYNMSGNSPVSGVFKTVTLFPIIPSISYSFKF